MKESLKRGRFSHATEHESLYTLVGLVVLLQAMVCKTSVLNSDSHELELTLVKGRSLQACARANLGERKPW